MIDLNNKLNADLNQILGTPYAELLRRAVMRAKADFERGITESNIRLAIAANPHPSQVHTYDDTLTQAMLLAIPSLGHPDEITAIALMTLFSHWIDDLWDAGHTPQLEAIVLQQKRVPSVDEIMTAFPDRHLQQFVRGLLNRWSSNRYLDLGLQRLMLGSLVFSRGPAGDAVRNAHDKMLQVELGVFWQGGLRTYASEFISLTTKANQELFQGFESPSPGFAQSFLYSLLYGPALYYHDFNEEDVMDQGTPETISPDRVAAHIRQVGLDLKGHADSRADLRMLQIYAVTESFSNVLPADVAAAYRQVADDLQPKP